MAITKRQLNLSLVTFLVVWVGSYLLLSRIAFHRADEFSVKGFYFVNPEWKHGYSVHKALVVLYFPLIKIDQAVGSGREPACEPLMGFSQ